MECSDCAVSGGAEVGSLQQGGGGAVRVGAGDILVLRAEDAGVKEEGE